MDMDIALAHKRAVLALQVFRNVTNWMGHSGVNWNLWGRGMYLLAHGEGYHTTIDAYPGLTMYIKLKN